jgi:subtilisin-like proprotein convertase family protein
MRFSPFGPSLRFGGKNGTKRGKRQSKATRAARALRRLVLEGLEDRTLLSSAPTPQIQLQQFIASSSTTGVNFDSPIIAVDPTNAQDMAAVYIDHSSVSGETSSAVVLFSTNGGGSWNSLGSLSAGINPSSSTDNPFPYTTDPSIAFDRSGHFFVLDSQHTTTTANDGAIVLTKFDFNSSVPTELFTTGVYAWDQSIDPGYNPALAVDGNAPSFTDPENTMATQTDTGTGHVFVAFNINYTPPMGDTRQFSDIVMRTSVDGGMNFGALTSITNGPSMTSDPAIVVAQGTNSQAANPITGGSVNVPFSNFNNNSIENQNFPNVPAIYIANGDSLGSTVSGTGTLTFNSNQITGLSFDTGLVQVGDKLTATGIPGIATILQINSATSITIDKTSTVNGTTNVVVTIPGTADATVVEPGFAGTTINGTFVSGSPTVTLTTTAGLAVGETASSPDLGSTTIKSIDSPTQVTMAGNASANSTAGGEAITFGGGASTITLLFSDTVDLSAGNLGTVAGLEAGNLAFSDAAGSVPAGTTVASTPTSAQIKASQVVLSQNTTVAGLQIFTFQNVLKIMDAGIGVGGVNNPVVTTYSATVNINSLTAPNFTTVSDLTVKLDLAHANLDQVNIVLVSPSGTMFHLLQNHTNRDNTKNTGIGLASGINLGLFNGFAQGTFFDDGAARSLTDGANKDPHIGYYIPDYAVGDSTFTAALDGALPVSVNGLWQLQVEDMRNNSPPEPAQYVLDWSLAFSSNLDTSLTNSAAGPVTAVPPSSGPTPAVLPSNATGAPFPTLPAVEPDTGIGPSLAVAQDNTLGAFSPFQGRIYLTYVAPGLAPGDSSDIMLVTSDNGGRSWSPASRVNDDNPGDNFSEGNRSQFMPQVTVDQSNGDLLISYFDARNDASNARVVTSVTVSVDGGNSFSSWQPANVFQTATDAITGQVLNQEPIPENESAGNGNRDKVFGFGTHQGLTAVDGHLVALWASNQNSANQLSIFEAVAGYAAGPRIISSTQGPVAGSSLNNTFAADGQQLADRFEVLFDRPVDPNSFSMGDVTVQFRSPTMPLTVAGIPLTVLSVSPEDSNAFGATRFLIKFDPTAALTQGGTYTGTYSYAVGPLVNDRIRSAPNGIGNSMDQNANGTPAEPNVDQYSAPGTKNGVPFQLPYTPDTLPLIVAGPHIISTIVPGNPPVVAPNLGTDNLVLNGTTNAITVVFDRDIDPTSFTSAQVLRMIGPIGPIPGGFTVTANPPGTSPALANRTFQIGFPTQFLSGSYSITLAPTIRALNNGDLLDTNLNAGLDILRGGSTTAGTNVPVIFTNNSLPLTIGPNSTVTATLNITNPFLIQGITTQLSITAMNDPDLEATLVHPDGTKIKLFTKVGNILSGPHSNFTNTVFDDAAPTPIEQGVPPFNIGSFNPQIPLSGLKGKTSAGTWKLIIKNDAGNTNTLTAWSLTLLQNIPGTNLGEPIVDQANVDFRIFTNAPDNVQSQTTWTPVGGASNNATGNSGRIGGIAIDPSDPSGNTVYVAGASGGVWKTSDFLTNDPKGPTYVPLLDFGPTYGVNTGSIAIFGRNHDPKQSIVVVGTGEGDALAGGGGPAWLGATPSSHGVGFLISFDGGNTWNVFDSTTNVDANGNILPINSSQRDHVFVGASVFKILMDPKPQANTQVIIYAAVDGGSAPGVYRSVDSGAHWSLMRAGNATDIAFSYGSANPSGNLQIIYAGFQGDGVYESPNQGGFWTQLLGDIGNPLIRDGDVAPPTKVPVGAPGSLPNGGNGRIVLATPALTGNPLQDTIQEGYLDVAVATGGGALQGLYITKDFGQNWTKVLLPVFTPNGQAFPTNDNLAPSYDPLASGTGGGEGGQGNYDISLAVDPTNANILYLGGTSDFHPLPAGGLIRVDTTLIRDAHNLTAFSSHRNDGGTLIPASLGGVSVKNPANAFGLTTHLGPFINLIRDPDHPFITNNTLFTTNVASFTNDGFDITWMPFNDVVQGTTDQHRLVTMVDPLTGHARLIFGDDQGVFSGVDMGNGTLDPGIGSDSLGTGIDVFATGSRNGNLQITQNYYGAAQPSILAAQIAGAIFYGSAQDNGFPQSDPHALQDGNIGWTGPLGDGMGVATDQTGTGTLYQYRWPCCTGDPTLSATDFFVVTPPGGTPVGRTFKLLLAGDDPNTSTGEWPFLGGSNFAVNPIDPNGIAISPFGASTTGGRIFRTQDEGKNWFVIGNPSDLDSTYAPAIAFGAPHTSDQNNLDNFIYAGTLAGNIWVTSQGGGTGTASTWTKSFAGDGTPVQQIVTNPKRDSNEAFAVTLTHVYHTMDSLAANPVWTDITGNLFSLTHTFLGNGTLYTEPILKYLSSIQADWRFATPTQAPYLYVAGEGGVFRSTNGGSSWSFFPDVAHQGAAVNGGYLPDAHITALNLALGNIDEATGLPKDTSTGLNLLLATTYGHGSFAIRLDQPLPTSAANSAGPTVFSVTDASSSSGEALTVKFGSLVSGNFVASAVDPTSFTPSDVVLKDPNGNVIPILQIVDSGPIGDPTYVHNQYTLMFSGTVSGNYSISIGKNVTDFSGDKMAAAFNGTVTVNPAARPQETLPFDDAFTGSFNQQLGREWVNGPGYFLIQNSPTLAAPVQPVSSYAVAQAPGNNIAILQLTSSPSNVAVQADVDVTSTKSSNVGLIARYLDANDYYLGEIQDLGGSFSATIIRVEGGVQTTLATTSVGAAFGSLRFEVADSSLKLFLNGTLVTYAQDLGLSGAGAIGMFGTQGTTLDNFHGENITLTTPPLTFTDTFNMPSFGSQLSFNWLDRLGNIKVVNGQAVGQAGFNLSTIFGLNQPDVTISANVALTSGQTAGLVTRYGGPLYSNFYLGQLRDIGGGQFQAAIFKNIGGTFTTLAVGSVVNTGTGPLEFESTGPSLKLIFNGAVVAFAQDLDLTGGSVGMRLGAGVAMSNVVVANAGVQLATLPFTDNFSTTSDGSQLDRFWTDQFGNIGVPAGQAVGVGAINLSTLNGISQGDVKVDAQVNVAVGSGQTVGLVARYGGPLYSNFYLAQIRDTGAGLQAAIFKNIGGVFTTIAVGSTFQPAAGGANLEFEVLGSSLKLIYGGTLGNTGTLTGGTLVAFGFDTSLTTGSVGMRLSQGAAVSSFSAFQGVVTNVALPFTDNFTTASDGGGAQLDSSWRDQLGNISVNGSNQAVGTSDTNLSVLNGLSQGDAKVDAQVNVAVGSGQTVGLVARYGGPGYSNFYLAQIRDTGAGLQAAIFKNIGGVFTTIAVGSTFQPAAGGANLEFEVVGSSLKLIYGGTLGNTGTLTGGTLVAFGFDTSLTTGSVGMRLSQGAAVSSFSAYQAVVTNVALPFTDNFTTPSDGGGAQLDSSWRDQLGNISVNGSNQAVGTSDTNLSVLNGLSQGDAKVDAQVNVAVGSGQTVGLVARYGGPGYSNFYLAQIRDTGAGLQAAIFKNISGVFTTIAVGSTFQPAAGGANLEFEVVGSSLKLIYGGTLGNTGTLTGGTLVAFGFDTSLTTGSVGMRLSNGAAVSSFSAYQATVTPVTIPPQFKDNFSTVSDGGGAQLDSSWRDQLGNISVNGSSQAFGVGDTNLSTVNGVSIADATVTGDINLLVGSGQTVGLVARYGGPGYSNFYLAQLRDTGTGLQAAIFKNIGGTFTTIAVGITVQSGTGTLKFKLSGTSLELDLGSTVLASVVDSSITAAGSVGMRLSTGATLGTFTADSP